MVSPEEQQDMILRLFFSFGVFAAGYYLGREVGRHEPVRRELERGRSSGLSEEIGRARSVPTQGGSFSGKGAGEPGRKTTKPSNLH